jgi:hypothetical protein
VAKIYPLRLHRQYPLLYKICTPLSSLKNPVNLLESLFGDDGWVGKERISNSDVDEERGESEDVEMAADTKNQSEEVDAQMEEEDDDCNETANEDLPLELQTRPEPDLPPRPCRQRSLKIYSLLRKVVFLYSYSPTSILIFSSLFSIVGFSLLGHLDLRLELNDEYTIAPQTSTQCQAASQPYENTEASRAYPIPAIKLSNTHHTPFIPNAHKPLFFPIASSTHHCRSMHKGPFHDCPSKRMALAGRKGWVL